MSNHKENPMREPMNPEVKPGVTVEAIEYTYSPSDEEGSVAGLSQEVVHAGPGGALVIDGDSGVRVTILNDMWDITGCFRVVEPVKKRVMTVREVAEEMAEDGWKGKFDPWAIMLTAALCGKEACEKLLSEKLGEEVEIGEDSE